MDITIRTAVLQDLDTLKSFEQEVIAFERPFAPNLKPDPINYYDLKDLMQRPDAEVVVATVGNQIVGSGYYRVLDSKPYKNPPTLAYLGFMYVVPEFRGNGINGKIIEDLMNRAQNKGMTEFQLDVFSENSVALNAYQKMGFKPYLLNMRLNTEEQ